jgi:hypothetical protein
LFRSGDNGQYGKIFEVRLLTAFNIQPVLWQDRSEIRDFRLPENLRRPFEFFPA